MQNLFKRGGFLLPLFAVLLVAGAQESGEAGAGDAAAPAPVKTASDPKAVKPAETSAEKPTEKPTEKPMEKPMEKVAAPAAPEPAAAEKALEKAAAEEKAKAKAEPKARPAQVPATPTVAGAIPAAYGLYRYEPIWKNSPFMLETPLNTIVTESFAKDLAVTSVSTIDGKTRVGYVNTKTRATSSATNLEPNGDGILVASVQANPDPSKVVVEFSQGGKSAKVSYDPMTLQGKPTIPKPAATPRTAVPGAPSSARPPVVAGQKGGSPPRSSATRRRIVLPKSLAPTQGQPAQVQPPRVPPVRVPDPAPTPPVR